MKSILSKLSIVLMVLLLAGCGGEDPISTPETTTELPTPDTATVVATEATASPTKISESINEMEESSELGIDPEHVFLKTQGLPYDWEASVVPATPYNASMPSGSVGLPEHIQVNFTPTGESQIVDPIMYIIPVDAYRQLWEKNDNDTVSRTIDAIFDLTVELPSPALTSGLPVLPMERISGRQDFAVQIDRAANTDISASKNGFRFVGRFAQDMNPVTSDGLPLQYIYQGFTNDGEYLVAFFYQVNSSSLPTNAEVSEPFNTAVSNGQYDAFIAQQAAALDALDLSDWEPVLTSLDDLVGSLTIIGIPESGIQNQLWQLTGHSNGESIEPLTNTDNYTVVYLPNGVMKYQTDCNSGNGTYDVTGGVVGSIAMGLGASTMAECGPNSYADQMIANFVAAQSYLVQPGGHQMELVQPTGGSLVYINLGSADEGDGSEPEVELPTPEANVPYGRVTTPLGVNVRTGPDELYPIIGTAPQGAESLIIGRSADGEWWVVPVPVSGTDGWVSAAYMETINTENMPIIPPPPPPIPTATPTATPLPEASINFWADSTTINQGECTTLRWDVENIQAVWVYPLGEPYDQYPITGQGNQEVCPTTTTTYEMRVLKTDGSVELRQITIVVIDTDPLANTNWQVVSFDGGSQVPLPATTLTAVFGNNNNISGDSGCNTFNGGYTASGSIISIGPLATTQKFCQEGINNQEHAYLAALQSAATYTISGSQLILRNASGVEVARFNRIG